MKDSHDLKVVVIGGGTGSFTVLSGLKRYVNHISALVSMADDGGSTGALRDELGVLPPGDARQCLVALSESSKARELFNYRFDEGGLSGHSFGNLFLTALEKMTGSFAEAIDLAGEVLDINGHRVIPTTLDKVTLVVNDGEKDIRHEREIRYTAFANPRPQAWLEPRPEPNREALKAIAEADLVIIAPGGLYESLGASLIIPGLGQALAQSPAKKIYVCNLMNQEKHTANFSVVDYADELERLAGAEFLDEVVYNTNTPSNDLLEHYALEGEHPVAIDDLPERHYKLRGADLLSRTVWYNKSKSDTLANQRALIRHDSTKVAQCVLGIYEKPSDNMRYVKTLFVLDMDRTLIRTGSLFRCVCEAANEFQDHLGDELANDYRDYQIARDTVFTELNFNEKNEYIKMRLAGKNATFSPTAALNRILAKRLSSARADDVYNSMAEQLLVKDKYAQYLLPGAEELLEYINERDDADLIILTYGELAFQDAKFKAVMVPLLRKIGIKQRYLATPRRKKSDFFAEHQTEEGNYEIRNLYGVEDIHAEEAVHVGDEREDIIDCENLQNYRAYCVKSPLAQSDRPWPTDEELVQNNCLLFESLFDVIEMEKKLDEQKTS